MKPAATLATVLALFAVACGGSQDESRGPDALETQQAALLGPGSLDGTWCHGSWPGCFTVSGGNGYMDNNADACWRAGDLKFANITYVSDGHFTATRYMHGSGVCDSPLPESDSITMADINHFTEVTSVTSFSASWYRPTP